MEVSEVMVSIKNGKAGLGWFPYTSNGSYRHGLGRYVSEGWERFSPYFPFEGSLNLFFSYVLFWHDRWCDDLPLRELSPALFCSSSG